MIARLDSNSFSRNLSSNNNSSARDTLTAVVTQNAETIANSTPAKETIESEIARLTWAVLDGAAGIDERRRLAELVAEQHKQRPA